jgi:hypothetical protein
MSSQPILGVDPGAHGAIAVLTGHGEIVQIWDMPTLEDGPAGRRNVNAALLAEIAYRGDRLTLATHYIRAADAIRGVFECLICGHNGDRPRGHSSLIGALDVQTAVNCDAAENIIAELELSKDGPIGLQFVSRLVPVQIGVDQDGDTVTSCVVEKIKGAVVSARKSRKTRAPPKFAQTALRALRKAIEELGEQATPSNTIPASARVVSVDTWRTYAYRAGISDTDNDDARRVAFSRAHKALVDGNHVQAWGEYRWLAE